MNKHNAMLLSYRIMEALFENGAEQAMVAGGAIRDYILGKEIKDVDVFVLSNSASGKNRKLLKYISENYKRTIETKYDSSSGFSVYEADGVNVIVIDKVFSPYKTLDEFISNTFDIGLCMVACDITGTIYANNLFHKDVEEKTITIYPRFTMTPAQIHRAIFEHSHRLKAKYPDHEIIISTDGILPKSSSSVVKEEDFILTKYI